MFYQFYFYIKIRIFYRDFFGGFMIKITFLIKVIVIAHFLNLSSNAQITSYNSDQRTQSLIAVSGLSNIPPLFTDMPLDCMIGYILMDSLSRTASISDVKSKLLTLSLDSLRVAARFMYAVMDYSPKLLMRYMTTTRDSIPGGRYMSFPANSYYGTEFAILQRMNEFGKNYAMLLKTHYIFRITVDTVVTGIDTTYSAPKPWVNVSCTVQEKIKGKILPNNCSYDADKTDKQILTINENCLNFGYPMNWMTGVGFFEDRGVNTGTNIRTLQKGEEYYVFLEQISLWKLYDYLTPTHQFEATGGLFKIIDGKVEDPSNFWGLGTNPTETDFHNNLLNLISNIKGWWIQ